MVSFKIKSDESLTVQLAQEFNITERERINLIIESLFDPTSSAHIYFSIDRDLQELPFHSIEAYCESLPYNYSIIRLN
ncbi:hypothetical protein ATE92_0056 [Ulvibacter sp. MAR_2010_11]|nr:hypothetical protein ATE92_0056 [Ulvibacter sp. MAR_2010_11]